MNFGQALELLKSGNKVSRTGWENEEIFLQYVPENISYIGKSIPHISITINNKKIPWTSTQIDILAEDWLIIK